MKQSGVYAIRNTVSGKSYVGSSVDLRTRKRAHFAGLHTGKHHSQKLQRSWDKHGPGAFVFEVLEITSGAEAELRQAEQCWIDRLGSVVNGYNVAPVAGSPGRTPKSDAHKRRIGDARRGAKHTEATRLMLSLCASTRPAPEVSDETRMKLSKANTGKRRTAAQREALSAAKTGKKVGPMSPEHKSAIAASKRGKPLSEAHKQRIREGLQKSREACHAH